MQINENIFLNLWFTIKNKIIELFYKIYHQLLQISLLSKNYLIILQNPIFMQELNKVKVRCEGCFKDKRKTQDSTQVSKLTLALCCTRIMCETCFSNQQQHACSVKTAISHAQATQSSVRCTRCLNKEAAYECSSCETGRFCQECNFNIHRKGKYSLHSRKKIHPDPNGLQKNPQLKINLLDQNCEKINYSRLSIQTERINPEIPNCQSPKNYLTSPRNKMIKNRSNSKLQASNPQLSAACSASAPFSANQISQTKACIQILESQLKISQTNLKKHWSKIDKQTNCIFQDVKQSLNKVIQKSKTYLASKRQFELTELQQKIKLANQAQIEIDNLEQLLNSANKDISNQSISYFVKTRSTKISNFMKEHENYSLISVSPFKVDTELLSQLKKTIQKSDLRKLLVKQKSLKNIKSNEKGLKRMTSSTLFSSYKKSSASGTVDSNDLNNFSRRLDTLNNSKAMQIDEKGDLKFKNLKLSFQSSTERGSNTNSRSSISDQETRKMLRVRSSYNMNVENMKSSCFVSQSSGMCIEQNSKNKQRIQNPMKKSTKFMVYASTKNRN